MWGYSTGGNGPETDVFWDIAKKYLRYGCWCQIRNPQRPDMRPGKKVKGSSGNYHF